MIKQTRGRPKMSDKERRKMLSARVSPETIEMIKDITALKDVSIGGLIDDIVKLAHRRIKSRH